MKNSVSFNLLVFSLLASCAHNATRGPAALWHHQQAPKDDKKTEAKPATPKKEETKPDPKAKKEKTTPSPDHGASEGTPDQSAATTEARVGCSDANLDKIDMGNGFSASDVLHRISTVGTFSGRLQIPTAQINNNQYVVSYATSVENDRNTLQSWFMSSAPDSQASDVYEAAKGSEAYRLAVNFVNGNGAVRVVNGRVDVGHRIAALMAVMFAAAKSGNYDCVRLVENNWVKTLLPDAQAQALMNASKAERAIAVEGLRDGSLHQTYREFLENRQRIYADIQEIDQLIAAKEQDNANELKFIDTDLRQSAQMMLEELKSIPPCRHHVSTRVSMGIGSKATLNFAEGLVNACVRELNTRLNRVRHDQNRVSAEIRITEGRKDREQKLLDRAISAGKDAEAQRRREAIALHEAKIEELNQRFDELGEKAEPYADYVSQLTDSSVSSVTMELDRMQTLLGDRQVRRSADYFKEEKTQLNQLRSDLRNNSSAYLTLGFMGGFDSAGIAAMIGAPR